MGNFSTIDLIPFSQNVYKRRYFASFFVALELLLFNIAVNEILLCSNNPILIKSIYGILRDEGCYVEVADHPADAVQMVFKNRYSAVIMGAEPFGLSVGDAVRIMKTVQPDMIVIFVGFDKLGIDVLNIDVPVDLEEFKEMIRDITGFQDMIRRDCL